MAETGIDALDRLRRLAPVELSIQRNSLSANERAVLKHLIYAAEQIDAIFWQQTCPNADSLKRQFEQALRNDNNFKYFAINYGPYDRLAENEPFLPVGPKPIGVGFYPADLNRNELLSYLQTHEKQRASIESPYTVIERIGTELSAVPYHVAYADHLKKASEALMRAAAFETRESARRYLEARATALLNDDYYVSDIQWIELPINGLDVVIGPYEVYEDELIGVKAAYEAIVTIQDPADALKVARFVRERENFQRHLTDSIGLDLDSPGEADNLVVADLVHSAGDARKGIPSIAFTLPNDERVIEEKGTKEVILKNVLEAKFQHVLLPICERLGRDNFDPVIASRGYLHHTVLHEICHSLGPHRINVAGNATTVNRALGELYTTLEEAKADVLAACWLLHGSDASGDDQGSILASYLPGLVRAIRFGNAQAHGRASLLQLNYLADAGALTPSADRLTVASPLVLEDRLFSLAREILTIQAQGDYDAAQRLIARYCQQSVDVKALVEALKHLPIDIVISFPGQQLTVQQEH
jgi:hypothetical protein